MNDSVPGMVDDPDEVARFAAERDEDTAAERRLSLGQGIVLLVMVLITIAMLALGGR
jgi:hypothetical protein